MSNGISISGIKEIDEVLRGLSKQTTHKILQNAHADAAKPLIYRASMKSPLRSGNLSNSIGVKKIALTKAKEIGAIQVGPLRGNGKKGHHAHLLEFGHRLVRAGRQIGFVRAFPFMKPSFELEKNKVESNIAGSLAKMYSKYMNKIIKKYA